MNQHAQLAMYIIGLVLLAAGAMTLGQQFSGTERGEYTVPCTLLVTGVGIFGLGLFWPTTVMNSTECQDPDGQNTPHDDDANGNGDGE
jgi:hypothetical protein